LRSAAALDVDAQNEPPPNALSQAKTVVASMLSVTERLN